MRKRISTFKGGRTTTSAFKTPLMPRAVVLAHAEIPQQKQARQESNLQPPVLEPAPRNAGVAPFVGFQRLSSEPPTPALLDNAGVDTNPGTEEELTHPIRKIASLRWSNSAVPPEQSPRANGHPD
jgi:hypothetical protein